MESSRAEALLKGASIPHTGSTVATIQVVDNNIRKITMANGSVIHVSKTRLKSLVDVTLKAQARAKATPAPSPGRAFANLYAQRQRGR